MSSKPLISVIIPAYNVAPYIRKSVQSVIEQTYKNLQIILIEDGATDDTGKICDDLAAQDSRIEVIHQKNGGLSAARNAGLNVAKGEWIAFLDSDDWIEPEMYEALLKLALDYDADISSCCSRNVYPDTTDKPTPKNEVVNVLDTKGVIRDLLHQTIVRFEVWNKLWSRELIGDMRFKVGQVAEDVYWDRVLFLKANKFVHTNRVLHNYVIDRPGNTNASFKIARLCIFNEFDLWIENLNKEQMTEEAEIIACIATTFAIAAHCAAIRAKQPSNIIDEVKSHFSHFYEKSKQSPYRNKTLLNLYKLNPKLYLYLTNSGLYDFALKCYHFIKR